MMDPAERKLMLQIAKSLETLGEEVKEIKTKTVVVPESAVVQNKGGIIQTISFERAPNEVFKMDVQFNNSEGIPLESRQKKSEMFLMDMERLLKEYDVINLEGSYVR